MTKSITDISKNSISFFFLFILFYHYLIIYKKLKKGSEKPGKNLNYELRIGIFDEWNQEPLLFRHPKGM